MNKVITKILSALAVALLVGCGIEKAEAAIDGFTFKTVSSLPDIKLLRPKAGDYCMVFGWASSGDGGGGLYKCETASGATNYGVVASTVDTAKQWVRVPGFVSFSAPPRTQTLTAASNILAEAVCVRVAGSGGAVLPTAAPTIRTNGVVDGQLLYLEGTHDSNTIGISTDSTGLVGSAINLNGSTTNRTLGAGDILLLKYNSTIAKWEEVAFSDN